MVISLEWAKIKAETVIFALIFIFLGLYPFLIDIMPKINIADPIYAIYGIIILGVIQLIRGIKMKREPIY